MSPKIALAMIIGANEDPTLLKNCLESVKDHVDGIFLNLNAPKGKKIPKKLMDTAKRYTDNIIEAEWTGNFVGARTQNFAQVPEDYQWILWLDTDDIVENPEKIKEVCAIVSPQVDGIYINYDYAHDEYGNVTVSHYNARIVRNNGTFRWKSSFSDGDVTVHETLNETRKVGKVMNNEWKVIHRSNNERMDESLRRNIQLLEGMLDNSADSVDPRVLYYLATHYVDAGFYARAKLLFERYLEMSGWAEERSQAWGYLGDIYFRSNDTKSARGCYMRALAENPKDGAPYVELGELEMRDGLWAKAIEWLEMAVAKKPDLTSAIQRPMETTYRAYKLLSDAYANIGSKGYKKASKYLTKAIELRPYDPELQDARNMLDELMKVAKLNKAVVSIVNELKDVDESDKVLGLIDSLPTDLQASPLIHQLRSYHAKPKSWPERSIAIFAGGSAVGTWGPWSLEDGVGGSEEAIIQLSRILADKGYEVTVYAIPGTRAGEYDGVQWRHYWEFNAKDRFDVFIGWRNPELFDQKIKARKKYLWLHDVIEKEELTEHRLNNVDKVIFVGQYHRDLYDLPDEKCFVSGNGIDPEAFTNPDIKRDPHRCVYQSAHERGLELLYKVWPDVIKEVPDATLDVYYGWTGFDAVNRDNPERMAWKQRLLQMQERLADHGVTNHGKIGHEQIIEEIYGAGVWAYPTPFPEVYPVHGDSLIECLDGKHKIKDLLGKKDFKVYSCNKDGELSISTVKNVFLTRKDTKMLKIGFKSGVGCKANEVKYLTLTPDHEVMMRDGTYCPAENLEVGDSVKAFHRHKNGHGKGYDHIGVTDKPVVAEHRFVAEKLHGQIPEGYHVDHLDSDTTNNIPENLEIKSNSQHWLDTWSRKSEKEKEEWNKVKRSGIIKKLEELGPEVVYNMKSKAAKGIKTKLGNHQVVSIEKAPNADAYCMEVEPDHNFVANGIFVHNCITGVKAQAGGAWPVTSDYAALKETVKFGDKTPMPKFDKATNSGIWGEEDLEKYKQSLIKRLKNPPTDKEREEMMKWAKENMSWEATARNWDEEFRAYNNGC